MAVTKIWAVKCRIEDALDYTTNEGKTMNPDYDIEPPKHKATKVDLFSGSWL